jgi:hypothetical protein
MGADKQQALRVTFDRRLRTEFHGSKATSDAGLAYRELDEALGLTDRGGNLLNDWRTGQNAVNWTRLSCHDFVDNQVWLQLFMLAYNLGNFLRQAVLPRAVRHWTLTTLREKLIKIGAKVVRHAPGVVFQVAEVAVPRELFRAILESIGKLRLLTPVSG